MKSIKILIRFILTSISRFFYNMYGFCFFILNGSSIKKPLHLNKLKYLKVGKNVTIDSFGRLDCYESSHTLPNLVIGDNTMIGFNFTALCSTDLIIGKNVLIASHVFISTEDHGNNPECGKKYLSQELISKPVYIEDNVWIGEKVTICKGVRIGKFSIIGANSVVTKDVQEYCMVAGIPAQIIKKYNFKTHMWEKI